jgi:transposase
MAGRSPVSAHDEQRRALVHLGRSRDRAEADRARAILLTLSGWTSPEIAAAFGAREDTVRLWRGAFMRGGVEALRKRVPRTLPRLADEIERRAGLRISRSRLSVVLRQRGRSAGDGPAAP